MYSMRQKQNYDYRIVGIIMLHTYCCELISCKRSGTDSLSWRILVGRIIIYTKHGNSLLNPCQYKAITSVYIFDICFAFLLSSLSLTIDSICIHLQSSFSPFHSKQKNRIFSVESCPSDVFSQCFNTRFSTFQSVVNLI